jgi:hypothetical protein
MKRLVLSIIIGLLISGLAACSGISEKGLLHGKVKVGPISPVEQSGVTNIINCDVYDARKIMIYDEDGKELIHQVDIECNSEENYARYSIELTSGVYMIDINHIGIDFSHNVPEKVVIKAGTTTRLDIEIDTGIR